jgi:hypothetical protein
LLSDRELVCRDSGKRLEFGAVVLHRDDFSVAETHDGCCLGGPFRAANLAGVGHDDHGVATDVTEVEFSRGEPRT